MKFSLHGLRLPAALLLAGLSVLPANAALIGTLKFSGSADVSLLGLDFVPASDPALDGTGLIVTNAAGNNGVFAPLNGSFTTGTVRDRNESTAPVSATDNTFAMTNWLTLAALPNLDFTLTQVLPGNYTPAECFAAPADQQTCTPAPFDHDSDPTTPPLLSPYNLTNSQPGNTGPIVSTAEFNVRGTVRDTVTNEIGAFTGRFVANLRDLTINGTFTGGNIPYQAVLAAVLAGGKVEGFNYAATLDVQPIPEPGTWAISLGGLALVGTSLLRRRK